MTEGERRELVAAVREALGPFKRELKAEIQTELLEPMEARLRSEMGEMESRLQGQITILDERIVGLDERMERLEVEVHSITSDVLVPFIEKVDEQHRELVKRLDLLEVEIERNRDKIDRILISVQMQERRLLNVFDDVTAIRQRLNSMERRLSGEVTYDVAQAELLVAQERSVYEMIRDLEERVARLEAEEQGGSE